MKTKKEYIEEMENFINENDIKIFEMISFKDNKVNTDFEITEKFIKQYNKMKNTKYEKNEFLDKKIITEVMKNIVNVSFRQPEYKEENRIYLGTIDQNIKEKIKQLKVIITINDKKWSWEWKNEY